MFIYLYIDIPSPKKSSVTWCYPAPRAYRDLQLIIDISISIPNMALGHYFWIDTSLSSSTLAIMESKPSFNLLM